MSKRSNGEGTIFKRKDGRWCGAYFDKEYKRHYIYGKTRAEVREKLKNGQLNEKLESRKKYVFQEWVKEYLEDYKKNEIKITTYGAYMELYRKHINGSELGKKLLSQITVHDLQAYYNFKIKSGYSSKTVMHIQVIINSALEQAVREKMIMENPNRYTILPKKNSYEAKVLTVDEIKYLLENAKEDDLYPIVILAIFTGMRKGEIMGLHWSDVDFENGAIHVTGSLCRVIEEPDEKGKRKTRYEIMEPKTKKSIRYIPMTEVAREALMLQRERQNEFKARNKDIYVELDLVFTEEDGTYIKQRPFMDRFHDFLKRYGVTDCRFHDLRHSFATMMLEMGTVSTKTMQEVLGHSSITTTLDIYSHVSQTMKKAALNEMDALFKEKIV